MSGISEYKKKEACILLYYVRYVLLWESLTPLNTWASTNSFCNNRKLLIFPTTQIFLFLVFIYQPPLDSLMIETSDKRVLD